MDSNLYKILMPDLPTKMTRWLSDFLVGRVIQVNVNGFLSDKISPIAGVPQGSVLSLLLFLFLKIRGHIRMAPKGGVILIGQLLEVCLHK